MHEVHSAGVTSIGRHPSWQAFWDAPHLTTPADLDRHLQTRPMDALVMAGTSKLAHLCAYNDTRLAPSDARLLKERAAAAPSPLDDDAPPPPLESLFLVSTATLDAGADATCIRPLVPDQPLAHIPSQDVSARRHAFRRRCVC